MLNFLNSESHNYKCKQFGWVVFKGKKQLKCTFQSHGMLRLRETLACAERNALGNAYLSSLTKNLEYEEREQLDSGSGGALSQGAGHDGSFYRYAV